MISEIDSDIPILTILDDWNVLINTESPVKTRSGSASLRQFFLDFPR